MDLGIKNKRALVLASSQGLGLGIATQLCKEGANVLWVYADSCGLKTAFLGNGGRNAATIFSLRYSSSR